MLARLGGVLLAFLISGLGGALFYVLGAPLPWMLGAMSAAALVALCGGRWLMPAPVRHVARPVVGVLAGSAFSPAIAASIGQWWTVIIFIAAYTAVIGLLGYVFFRRLCRLDYVTAFFAAMPGGLGELTLLGGALGGSVRTLVMIHSVRIVALVFTIPFGLQVLLGHEIAQSLPSAGIAAGIEPLDWMILVLCGVAGYFIGVYSRLPGSVMVAAMFCSAAVHAAGITAAAPPAWLVALVQVVIGAVAGARFAGLRFRELRSTALSALAWSGAVLLIAGTAAALGGWIFGRPFTTMLLAVAPGGMAEMTVITYALGIDVAFVVTCLVCRIFLVLGLAPLIFRLLGNRGGGAPSPPLPARPHGKER
jgi:uncharacterized protein